MDWEDWLRKAAQRPSDYEDSKRQATEGQIKEALRASDALAGRPYRVYVKGSYANNTNVRLNYDVDIAVEYEGYFYYDMCFDVEGRPKSDVGVVHSTDPYTRDQFKADVKDALISAYGKSAIEVGNIAFRVREKKTTLPADVVPCWPYRRYDRVMNGAGVYQLGSCVFPSSGPRKVNYPDQQKSNGTAKNLATSKRYKRMVRALKRLQTRLIENDSALDEIASYHIECLVYNVPNDRFNRTTYKADMHGVLTYLFNESLLSGGWNDWQEVSELHYLMRGGDSPRRIQVQALMDAAWNELGFD